MHKACVIGYPLSHSLSPKLHGYWLKQYHIEGSYEARQTKPEDFETTVLSLRDQGWRGFNLTIPYKESILALLDDVDETASAIGAVNTVIIDRNTLVGSNTDAYGFMANIKQHAPLAKKRKAVILGAGGAARAVCQALMAEGFEDIIVANRTRQKALALVHHFRDMPRVVSWDERSAALENTDLLVNTTSLGLQGSPPLEMDLRLLPGQAIVSDIVYAPLDTPLLQAARKRGNVAVDGLGMLIHQGVPAFEAWFGVRPEVTDNVRNYMVSAHA